MHENSKIGKMVKWPIMKSTVMNTLSGIYKKSCTQKSKNNPKKETLPWQNRDARPTGDELDEDRQNQEGIIISVTT